MTTIILRQNLGNTQPRSTNVAVKGSPLHDYEVDNNFNNLNNDVELHNGLIEIAFNTANTKYSANGGLINGDVIISGYIQGNTDIITNSMYANSYYGNIDAGNF